MYHHHKKEALHSECYAGLFQLSNSIRRAETSEWSGNFTRLPPSKIHQARVCPRRLAAKSPAQQTPCRAFLIIEFHTPRGKCQIRTMPDHTSLTRLSASNMSESLAPGPAGRLVGRFYSTAVKQNPPGPSLSAATRRKKPCTANAVQGFPNYRIPYAERKLANGREILLDCRQAKSIRPEFVRGDSPLTCRRTRGRP